MNSKLKDYLEEKIDNIFYEVNKEYNLRSGDISPEEYLELTKIIDSLEVIVKNYIKYNKGA